MARRTPRPRRRSTPGRRSRGLFGRVTGLGLILVLGAWVLGVDVPSWLPEPAATAARDAEAWIEATLRDLGGVPPAGTDAPTDGGAPEAEPLDPATAAEALALLDRLRVGDERPRGYDRGAWPHWTDADGDCQDARQEVLQAESLERPQLTPDGCRVVSGLWRDTYTGETFRDPTRLDVDHMVPLAEAYRSGGRDWGVERRAAFANDLEDSRTPIAVSAAANRAKGDQGPEDWLPPEESARCRYIANWVAVKVRWSLSLDERERVTVGNSLQNCARG